MRFSIAVLSLLACTGAALATPMQDRQIAFEVLQQQNSVERTFSNCRFIRGAGNPDLLREWRDGNLDFVDAAKRVVVNQGGLTEPRRKIVEGIAAMFDQEASSSREACQAYFEKVRKGEQDISAKVASQSLRRIVSIKREAVPERIWVVDQRRLPNGTLAHFARVWDGDGDIVDCDATAAAKGHVWTRQRMSASGEMIKDADPELWMTECVASDVEPVTGKEIAETPPRT